MIEHHPDYTLRQVAEIVPCHERVLRRWMKAPGATPPFTWDDHSRAYRFPYAGVQEWLAARAVQRKALRKPYLRWLPAAPQQCAVA
jgi:hypothetical protein